jgi:hypothetical protein
MTTVRQVDVQLKVVAWLVLAAYLAPTQNGDDLILGNDGERHD